MRTLRRVTLTAVCVATSALVLAPGAAVAAPAANPTPTVYAGGCGGGGKPDDGCDRRTAKEWNKYAHEDHKYDYDEFFGYEANDHDYWDQDRHWYERGKFPPECKPAEPKPCPTPAPGPCPTC